jgi:hypothetical protein
MTAENRSQKRLLKIFTDLMLPCPPYDFLTIRIEAVHPFAGSRRTAVIICFP